MSEDRARYNVGPEDRERELCDNFIKFWRRENCNIYSSINSLLELIGTEAASGPYRRLYGKTLEWQKRLFEKNPEAYREMVEQRLGKLCKGDDTWKV